MKHYLLTALLLFAVSCESFSERGAPVTSYLEVYSAEGDLIAFFRTDGRNVIAMAAGSAQAGLFDKASGVTVFGPILAHDHKIRLVSEPRDFDEDFGPEEQLPAWVVDVGLFRTRAEAQALGFNIAPPEP